jgi:hypothetical protein
MSNINPVPVQPTDPATTELPTYLTPDTLVAYCDSRLMGLDSQMQSIFNQQQESAATTQSLSNLASQLNDLPAPNTASPPTVTMTMAQWKQIDGAYYQSIDELSSASGTPGQEYVNGVQTALGGQLEQDRSSLFQNSSFYANGTVCVPASTITNISQNLKTYTSNLNSDSQMQMINLQSMMSQQQTAVELSTNLLESMSQTNQAIASNCKAT